MRSPTPRVWRPRQDTNHSPEHAIAVTSQFYFCSLPLRLDPYRSCAFRCTYCFALARGGNTASVQAVLDPRSLDRRLARVQRGQIAGAVDEFLARRQPLHIGGMSDPFPPIERQLGVTLAILNVLADHDYPAIISTKSDLFAEDPYLAVLGRGTFIVQMSLSSLDARLLGAVDLGAPTPARRLAAVQCAAAAGVVSTLRVQPLLPGRAPDAAEVIVAGAAAGVRHVAVEHLKLPIERGWWGRDRLAAALGNEALRPFAERGHRSGREWILPVEDRLPVQLELRELARRHGLSFAAADTDLLWLSAGTCCCSGADAFPGFDQHFRCNYTEAIRRAVTTGEVSITSIRDEWRPAATLSRFVNSHSRLRTQDGRGAGMFSYLEANWNGSANGNSPQMYYGVVDSGERDADGFRIYRLSEAARALLTST